MGSALSGRSASNVTVRWEYRSPAERRVGSFATTCTGYSAGSPSAHVGSQRLTTYVAVADADGPPHEDHETLSSDSFPSPQESVTLLGRTAGSAPGHSMRYVVAREVEVAEAFGRAESVGAAGVEAASAEVVEESGVVRERDAALVEGGDESVVPACVGVFDFPPVSTDAEANEETVLAVVGATAEESGWEQPATSGSTQAQAARWRRADMRAKVSMESV